MDLKEVCRNCLLPSESMLPICTENQVRNLVTKLPILDLLKLFTTITISPHDELPDNICCDCLDKVRQSYNFKLKLEKSESVLKQLKDDGKIEFTNFPNEYELYTKEHIELIKTGNTADYSTSNKQLEQVTFPEIFEEGNAKQEISLIQEVKQEPGIDINMEEGTKETDSDKKCFKSDHRCLVCKNTFGDKKNLKAHMLTHTEEKRIQCEVYRKKLCLKKNLKKHTKKTPIRRSTKKVKCGTCSKLFRDKYVLNEHMRIHTGENPFQCKLCPNSFRWKSSLKSHMQTVHAVGKLNPKNVKCSTCSKLFINKYCLNEHMRMHTGETPFQCEVCLKKFRFKRSLKIHTIKGHADRTMNTKKVKCAICSKLYSSKSVLNRHMKVHTEKNLYQCNVCLKKFPLKRSLKIHSQTAHADEAMEGRRVKCAICSKILRHKNGLNEHMRIHTGEKPFQCKICPLNFRLKSSLKAHVQTAHPYGVTDTTSEFKCATCSKLFRHNYLLTAHMRIHTGEKPYQCEVCPKRFRLMKILKDHIQSAHIDGSTNEIKCEICSRLFRDKYGLNKHMRIHTGEKPFQCEACPNNFRWKSCLATHMQTEHASQLTNIKRLKCPTCSKLFLYKCSLNDHMRIHTGEKPFQCEVCSIKFRAKNYLKAHVQRMHPPKVIN